MNQTVSRDDFGLPPSDLRILKAFVANRVWRTANSLQGAMTHRKGKLASRVFLIGPVALFLFLAASIACASTFGKAESEAEAEHLLTSLFLISFTGTLAGCLSTSLQSLFMSAEVRYLATLPVPLRLVFYARFGDCARGALPGAAFGFAICVGYILGRAERAALLFAAIPILLTLVAAGVAIAALLTATIVRFVPPKRTRLALILTSLGILGLSTLLWTQYAGTELVEGDQLANQERFPIVDFTPPAWATSAMLQLVEGDWVSAIPQATLLLGVFLLVAGGAARTFGATFAQNIERTELAVGSSVPKPQGPVARRVLSMVPRATLPWVRREWTLVGRDFARISAAIWPISAIGLYVITTLAMGGDGSQSDRARFWTTHAPLLFVPWGLSLGTTIFAIGAESDRIGLIRSLPVRSRTLIAGKLVSYVLPIAGASLAAGVLAIVAAPGSPQDNYLLLILIAWFSFTFCAVDFSFAVASPQFDAEHVQRSTHFMARVVATAVGFLVVIMSVAGVAMSPLGNGSLGEMMLAGNSSQPLVVWAVFVASAAMIPTLLLIRTSRKIDRLIAAG